MHYDESAAGNVHAALRCQVSCLSLLTGAFCRARPSSALTLAFKSLRSPPVPAGANLSSSQKRPENVFRGNTLTRLEASALGGWEGEKHCAHAYSHVDSASAGPTDSVCGETGSVGGRGCGVGFFSFFSSRPRRRF